MRSKSSYESVVHGFREISRGARKLARTPKVIKEKKKKEVTGKILGLCVCGCVVLSSLEN
jgi:hypothetical protein